MNSRQEMQRVMPAMLLHEGEWVGTYRHIDMDGQVVDRHTSHVKCVFPDEGEFAYIQHNHFVWSDGRESRDELQGVLRDGRLWWDNEKFSGSAWTTEDNLILLNLDRKDEPGASFIEIIILGASGKHRARTWHWFKDGVLMRRTLCDERRLDSSAPRV